MHPLIQQFRDEIFFPINISNLRVRSDQLCEQLLLYPTMMGANPCCQPCSSGCCGIWCRIPTMVLTGDTAPEVLHEIQGSGAMLLHKPITPERLRSLMHLALWQGIASRQQSSIYNRLNGISLALGELGKL